MPKIHEVYGPLVVGADWLKSTNGNTAPDHWKDNDIWNEVRTRKGVYVFATKPGRSHKPWYVGKTTKTFESEAFADHKMSRYRKVLLKKIERGRPEMFF